VAATGLKVMIHALPEETTALRLAQRAARRREGRLFGLVDMIRLLQLDPGCEGRIAALAHATGDEAALGVLRAAASLSGASRAFSLPAAASPPRLLERARVGATGQGSGETLRQAYLCSLSFLSSDWPLRRARLLRTVLHPRRQSHVLWRATGELVDEARRRLRRLPVTERESFWSETSAGVNK
jgi:hypothetical protein